MNEKNIKKVMKEYGGRVRPSRMFALKMRWRIFKKGFGMNFFMPGVTFKYATAFVLVFFTFTSGVGAYAYTSPDVNMTHPLYPIKEGIENIEMGVAWTPEWKSQVHMKKAMHRLEEAEKLHGKFRKNLELEYEAEAIRKTLEYLEKEMDNSLSSAATEYDPEKAERVLNVIETKFRKMKDRIGNLPPMENGRPYIKKVRERMRMFNENAQEKIERLEYAREAVEGARRGNVKRIFFRELLQNPPPPPLLISE